jgi:hypothetical protein
VLGEIFGPSREEVTGKKRKLHSDELHDLSSSSVIQVSISKRMR